MAFPVPPNVFEFHLDATPGGTLTDFSEFISSVTFTTEREPTFLARGGGNPSAAVVGPAESSGSIEFWYDSTLWAALRAQVDQGASVVPCQIQYRPEGAGTGLAQIQADVFWSSVEAETDADGDAARGTADFSVTGPLVTTAQA